MISPSAHRRGSGFGIRYPLFGIRYTVGEASNTPTGRRRDGAIVNEKSKTSMHRGNDVVFVEVIAFAQRRLGETASSGAGNSVPNCQRNDGPRYVGNARFVAGSKGLPARRVHGLAS